MSATDLILRLIEHEVPEYGLVHLLDLPQERLEIIEMLLSGDSKVTGRQVGDLEMPEGAAYFGAPRGQGVRAEPRHGLGGGGRGARGARPRRRGGPEVVIRLRRSN